MRHYEVMVILDPELDERTVAPSLDTFLNVIRQDGGTVASVDVWGRRRLAYDIKKKSEGIYAILNVTCSPTAVAELDRQLGLNESVLRTKVMRPDIR
jgi:small subunit ribosomal protein S6